MTEPGPTLHPDTDKVNGFRVCGKQLTKRCACAAAPAKVPLQFDVKEGFCT